MSSLHARRWAVGLATVVVLAAASAFAQVPAPIQATLLLRILSFDRALPARAGSSVKVGVLFREGQGASEASQRELTAALTAMARKSTVARRPVEVVAVPFQDAARLETDFERHRISAAYVCPGLDEHLSAISKAAAARSVLTFAGSEDYVRKGVGIGLVLRDSKAGILIHLPTTKASGADLDSGLLRIAEVLR